MKENLNHQLASDCFNSNIPDHSLGAIVCSHEFNWASFLTYAGDMLITPGLYLQLKKRNLLNSIEPDALVYLKEIYAVNALRNRRILEQFTQIALMFNQVDITPLPLKGLSMLLSGVYQDPGERVLSDMDLLIKVDQLQNAIDAMQKAGYYQEKNEYAIEGETDYRNKPEYASKHVPRFFTPEGVVGVELHISFTEDTDRNKAFFLTHGFGPAVVSELNSAKYLHPTTNYELMTNFYHSQVIDKSFLRGRLDVRHLRDFSLSLSSYTDDQLTHLKFLSEQIGAKKSFHYYLLQSKDFFLQPSSPMQSEALVNLRYKIFVYQRQSKFLVKTTHFIFFSITSVRKFLSLSKLNQKYGPRNIFVASWMRIRHAGQLKSINQYIATVLDKPNKN